jgi:hypothetical protein
MKTRLLLAVASLFCTQIAQAEIRTFTNSAGKSIKAELVAMEGEAAVLKLGNGRTAKVPLKSLSAEDQTFIKAWWEKNKNNLNEGDVRLEFDKNTERIDRQVSKPKATGKGKQGNQPSSKMTKDSVSYACVLKNYSKKTVSDITVDYTIYKRVSTRGAGGSDTSTKEIDGSTKIALLEANGSATFETDDVTCVDSSKKGGNGPTESNRETVVGIVLTLSVGDNEFLKQSHPTSFLDRLEEEEKRQEDRDRGR